MAFYKTIIVNDKEYQYKVGRNIIKIKGLGKNSNIKKTDFFTDSRGLDGDLVIKEAVTPGMIADYINGYKIRTQMLKRATPQCNCGKSLSEKNWRCDPFDSEIHADYHYAMWCDECHERRSYDI